MEVYMQNYDEKSFKSKANTRSGLTWLVLMLLVTTYYSARLISGKISEPRFYILCALGWGTFIVGCIFLKIKGKAWDYYKYFLGFSMIWWKISRIADRLSLHISTHMHILKLCKYESCGRMWTGYGRKSKSCGKCFTAAHILLSDGCWQIFPVPIGVFRVFLYFHIPYYDYEIIKKI